MNTFAVTYFKILNEMASPREVDIAKTYYHGTIGLEKALSIFKNGISPRSVASRQFLAPIKDKVYVTPDIRTALIYALGGVMMGCDDPRNFNKDDRYGVVFEIPGKNLADIQPDEDSVGDIALAATKYVVDGEVCDHGYPKLNEEILKNLRWLYVLAKQKLTPRQFSKFYREDTSIDVWHAGKKLVGYLSDSQKLQLIDVGAHVAAESKQIIPSTGWLVDRSKSKSYKDDASNFFEISKRITLPELEMQYDTLVESFFDHAVVQGKYSVSGNKEVVPMFLNPDSNERKECGQEWRGLIFPNGDLYAIPEPYLHNVVLRELSLHGKIKNDVEDFYYKPDEGLIVQHYNGKVWLSESCIYSHPELSGVNKDIVRAIYKKCKEKNPDLEFSEKAIYSSNK